MGAVSKPIFDAVCTDVPCNALIHPWNESCINGLPLLYKSALIGSAKFYSIIYLAQILMRGKKMMKKEQWFKMGEYYVRSTLLGLLVTATGPNLSCIIRKLLGDKFTYYTYLILPFTLNGLFIYLEPPSRRGLVINLFCNLVIEYYLKVLQRAGYLEITKTRQTLMFMIGSSLLFYLMRLEGDKAERTPLFWFFTPEKVRRKCDGSSNVCPHEGPCQGHVAKSFATYFGIGAGISLARHILPQIRTPIKAISSIRGKHFKLAMFFGSYIGIYRAVICYLCRKKGFDSAKYALPAGYAAGLASVFSPSLGLSIASLTAAFKLFSTILYEKKILPSDIPLPELMYCFCQGTLFNARVLDPGACPNYVLNLMKSCSNGTSEMVFKSFSEVTKNAM
ncbi:transmembrane protein 135-like isoform X1 [Trichoplusia ni]|uniref:Transmembrane protein 135-like isoform X1 n=2 Tax=Trichoplusia ni TaxID=7111 RepID=A0A7E5VVA2_TRINI|nr:transmembrane protein 135-like isoform X1 [Trichoplusia ni]